jgi:hypothetical protein
MLTLLSVILFTSTNQLFFTGPRTLIRIASYEDPYRIADTSESVAANPLGDERTEGTGLESMTNLISVDSLFGGIPTLSENFSTLGDRFGSLFRRTSIPSTDETSIRCQSYKTFPSLVADGAAK